LQLTLVLNFNSFGSAFGGGTGATMCRTAPFLPSCAGAVHRVQADVASKTIFFDQLLIMNFNC
jgi:hypothetical protein